MQYTTTDHTANLSMSAIDEVFDKQLIPSDCGSLNSYSESLSLMWRTLKTKLCEQPTLIARTAKLYSKWNWKHFKTRMPMCAEKYFQMLQRLLRSWRFTLKDCALEKGKLNCLKKMGSKFLALYVIKLPWWMPCSGTWLLGCSILLSCCWRLPTILKTSGFIVQEVWCFCQNLMFWRRPYLPTVILFCHHAIETHSTRIFVSVIC